MEKLTFDQLLATVGGEVNAGELKAKKERLEKKKAELQERLAEIQKELREVEDKLYEPIRKAAKAAVLLNIEVPEEYRKFANGGGSGQRSEGKYYWEAKGHMPFKAEVSRAMWRLSGGSGGSAGKNGEGILSASEFWQIVGLTEDQVEFGRKYVVTLPNKKEIVFQRVEE